MRALFLVILAGTLAAAACGGRSGATPITIGVAGPLTRAVGVSTRQGIELAVSQIDAAGGVRGRSLRLELRDDSGDGARAARIAQQFVTGDSVVGVIGDVESGPTISAAKVYDGHLPLIATAATSPALTGISPWVFRVISSDSINGAAIARFANAMGRHRAAIIYENNSYGRGLADAFRRAFRGTVVSVDPIAADATDLEPYVSYYRRLSPDVVFAVGESISGLALLREARRQHLAADFIGGDGWTAIALDTAVAEGTYIAAPFTPRDPRPEVRRFVAAYRARFGADPDDKAALGYDAARLFARAIAAVGTDPRAVRDWLATRTAATAYHGVTGVIRFRADGDPVDKGLIMTRVHDGALAIAGAQP